MARHSLRYGIVTVDSTDDALGQTEDVFLVGKPSGKIVKVDGGFVAFAEGDHSATIGPEFSGGHETRLAAALSAVAMTERAPQVRAQIAAQIAATAIEASA